VKIALVTTWFERGAAHVSRQYRDRLEGEHEVAIYARGGESQGGGDPRWDQGDVTWGRSIPTHGGTAFHLGHFRSWLRRRRPDLVLFNEQHWWPPVLMCRDLGLRTAAYVDYYTEATVPLFLNYDLLLCHTRRHRSVFDWHPGCVYVPWGTRTDVYVPRVGEADRGDGVTFFHNAGHNPARKGTDLVLEAFTRMEHSARVVIHAQQHPQRRLPGLEPLIERLTAESKLELLLGDAPPPGLYHRGDVYVYPTRLEGVGLTVPEALACGLPVIVPNSPPMTEFAPEQVARHVSIARLQPRCDGYYWPQTLVDTVDLARQMDWCCADATRLAGMARAAREHAVRHLDWMRNAAELPALLERASPLDAQTRRRARAQALAFERGRLDVGLFYPLTARALLKVARWLRPLAGRYSGQGG